MYLSGYVYADHAGDTSDRLSRTGDIFRLEPIGPISWNSSKQELVSLSSAEAKFIAACVATREGLYLQELLDEAKFSYFRQPAEPTARRADSPPSRRPAEPTTRRAAEPTSRYPTESTTRRADASTTHRCPGTSPAVAQATPPAEPPDSRAARQPSRPTAEPPSSRAAELPCSRVATAPTGAPRPYLLGLCDRADGLSLFDLTSGSSPAPPATADSTVRSQWATRDAAARLAVRRHLPTTERAHFSQYKSAQTLYDAVVARYSSPATTALSRLMLPYLFPDLAAFPIVADLITHLRTSNTRYRAALHAEFCAKNPPPQCTSLSTT
ncbi:unnamed protein product [Closterium sp. NIES-54]